MHVVGSELLKNYYIIIIEIFLSQRICIHIYTDYITPFNFLYLHYNFFFINSHPAKPLKCATIINGQKQSYACNTSREIVIKTKNFL